MSGFFLNSRARQIVRASENRFTVYIPEKTKIEAMLYPSVNHGENSFDTACDFLFVCSRDMRSLDVRGLLKMRDL
jgi:hypothetical protein